MLTLGQSLIGKSVLSLRGGSPIGQVNSVLIDPNNLKIEGWFATDRLSKQTGIIIAQDIRDLIPQGMVVNDHDAITPPSDLVRLEPVINLHFTLVDKHVITEGGSRLGKVSDFAFDKDSMFIQKLYVSQSVIKSFSGGTLMIDRTQIIEVTERKIVVNDATVTDKSPITAPVPAQ